MRDIVASEWVTLDGVFDAGSMEQWFAPYDSPARQEYIREGILACDALLLGRVTFEMLAPYWSSLRNDEMGVAGKLNAVAKYVVSSSLKDAAWENSTVIAGNVVDEVDKLKRQGGREIQIEGSATLVRSLMDAALVDEVRLLVHPVVMGRGKRLFGDGVRPARLALIETRMLDLGVMLLRYRTKSGG